MKSTLAELLEVGLMGAHQFDNAGVLVAGLSGDDDRRGDGLIAVREHQCRALNLGRLRAIIISEHHSCSIHLELKEPKPLV
ncbi:MAG: hypothetical protein MZV65_31925 [Chromatiales bacterium]|nr:hypothetical protein [Chromatiales bacterium]